jgi:hypothetical protein
MADLSSLLLSDGFGLNKERRLRALNAEEQSILQLPFPYEVMSFSPAHFRVQSSEPDESTGS